MSLELMLRPSLSGHALVKRDGLASGVAGYDYPDCLKD